MDYQKLLNAAEAGRTDEVRELIAAGADVHACDDLALQMATDKGHLAVVRELLAARAARG